MVVRFIGHHGGNAIRARLAGRAFRCRRDRVSVPGCLITRTWTLGHS